MPNTLADHLRALPDDGLMALVRMRPDLAVPPPSDFSALAHRAQSRVSIARALDGLDRFTLEILDALRYTRVEHTTTFEAVLTLTASAGVEAVRVRGAVDRLKHMLVVYGPEHALRLPGAVDEVCSPYPAGLGRPAADLDPGAAALVADPAGLRRTLLAAPPPARAVLDRLAGGPPVGSVAPTSLTEDAESPVRWLIDRHLLVAIAVDTVELPREVGLLLRRDAGPLGTLHPEPPAPAVPVREMAHVDRAGTGQVLEVVRLAEALLDAIGAEPPAVLRAGGLGVRELRRLAKAVGLDEAQCGALIEILATAGLIGEDHATNRSSPDRVYLPSARWDRWRDDGIAARWQQLAAAWLAMARMPGLIGQRDDRDRPVNALSPESTRPGAPAQRRATLDVLASLPVGSAPSVDAVVDVLGWHWPRRVGRYTALGVAATLGEAALLGITGSGALTGYGRLLLEQVQAAPDERFDDPLGIHSTVDGRLAVDPGSTVDSGAGPPAQRAVDALDKLLPVPVDHLVLQADLTFVVPGPPEPALAAELRLLGVAESPSVYRVTPDSVRRALDTGHTAADLHALFARRSRTPVPQTLTYLIDDVARRHGGLRVGSANAYVRCDDEALLAEVLADRRLVSLGLRRLAPTVLLSKQPIGAVLEALRAAGYPPVPEDASGAAVLTQPKARRAPELHAHQFRHTDESTGLPRMSTPWLAGLVEQVRRGDALARAARRSPVTVRATGVNGASHSQALEVLQQALRDRARVWVGYVDAHGSPASRLVRPVSMGAGYLRAEDERTEMLHTFALHRITEAVREELT